MSSAQNILIWPQTPDRLGSESAFGPWVRPICAVGVSSFLFVFVGMWVGAVWLAIMLALELASNWLRPRSQFGVGLFSRLSLLNTFAISLWWVVHAVLLWRTGGELLRIATIMDLFTVALYGAIGTFRDRKMLLTLILPPLAALAFLLIQYLIQHGSPVIAAFASVATLGSCATIIVNALTMHRTSARLADANENLAAVASELELNRSFLEEVSDLSKIGGWQIDTDRKMVAWNRWTRSILDIDEGAAPDLDRFLEFFAEDGRGAVLSAIDKALHTGQGWDLQTTAHTRASRALCVRVLGKPVLENGRPVMIVGAIHDVTSHVETERELVELADAARAASRAKDEFLANMSHEIRTPLNGMLGLASVLGNAPLQPDQLELIRLIQSSGEYLDRLLSDLLDLSKIEAGKIEISNQIFDLSETIETAASLLRPRALEKGLAFDIRYGPGTAGRFECDAVRFRQIITNLISNAIKFTDAGAVTVLVEIENLGLEAATTTLLVEVHDTGIGFDAAASERIFNRFVQADGSITRKFGGTGLGLSISRRLAEAMGGTLLASSKPGEGSVFTLRLPVVRAADATALSERVPQRRNGGSAPEADHRDGPIRVLLAEDNPTNQRYFRVALEPSGFDVTIVGNGQEAVDEFTVSRFDAILLDMQMPVMDGLSAARSIRDLEKRKGLERTPIGMLTANAMKQHNQQAVDAGCDFFVTKPVLRDTLVQTILEAAQ
jgi:signal transduction histidine kinase/CheY-like chemotaxis protein